VTIGQLVGYSHAFLVAADRHAKAAKIAGIDGEVDGMMCIIALQNSVVGATQLLGADHSAVAECLAETRDLKAMRDMLTHFDEYTLGNGRLQRGRAGVEPVMDGFGWLPFWNTDETMLILSRRNGEETPTSYEVSIHEALRSVAKLVTAAFTRART
jgi:hypothetical protein